MADVAREAGVSVMTVSYVFSRPQRVSPGIRERVIQAARRLNYHGPDPAARSLARGRSNSVGVVGYYDIPSLASGSLTGHSVRVAR